MNHHEAFYTALETYTKGEMTRGEMQAQAMWYSIAELRLIASKLLDDGMFLQVLNQLEQDMITIGNSIAARKGRA